jgi:hypothetical protein
VQLGGDPDFAVVDIADLHQVQNVTLQDIFSFLIQLLHDVGYVCLAQICIEI